MKKILTIPEIPFPTTLRFLHVDFEQLTTLGMWRLKEKGIMKNIHSLLSCHLPKEFSEETHNAENLEMNRRLGIPILVELNMRA